MLIASYLRLYDLYPNEQYNFIHARILIENLNNFNHNLYNVHFTQNNQVDHNYKYNLFLASN